MSADSKLVGIEKLDVVNQEMVSSAKHGSIHHDFDDYLCPAPSRRGIKQA